MMVLKSTLTLDRRNQDDVKPSVISWVSFGVLPFPPVIIPSLCQMRSSPRKGTVSIPRSNLCYVEERKLTGHAMYVRLFTAHLQTALGFLACKMG